MHVFSRIHYIWFASEGFKQYFPQLIKSIAFFHIYNSEITTDSTISSNPIISIVIINISYSSEIWSDLSNIIYIYSQYKQGFISTSSFRSFARDQRISLKGHKFAALHMETFITILQVIWETSVTITAVHFGARQWICFKKTVRSKVISLYKIMPLHWYYMVYIQKLHL